MQDAGSVAILVLVPAVIRKKVGFVFLDRLSKKIPPTTTTSEQPASKPVLPDEKVNLWPNSLNYHCSMQVLNHNERCHLNFKVNYWVKFNKIKLVYLFQEINGILYNFPVVRILELLQVRWPTLRLLDEQKQSKVRAVDIFLAKKTNAFIWIVLPNFRSDRLL